MDCVVSVRSRDSKAVDAGRFMLARVSKQEFDNYIKKEVGIENGARSISHLFAATNPSYPYIRAIFAPMAAPTCR